MRLSRVTAEFLLQLAAWPKSYSLGVCYRSPTKTWMFLSVVPLVWVSSRWQYCVVSGCSFTRLLANLRALCLIQVFLQSQSACDLLFAQVLLPCSWLIAWYYCNNSLLAISNPLFCACLLRVWMFHDLNLASLPFMPCFLQKGLSLCSSTFYSFQDGSVCHSQKPEVICTVCCNCQLSSHSCATSGYPETLSLWNCFSYLWNFKYQESCYSPRLVTRCVRSHLRGLSTDSYPLQANS